MNKKSFREIRGFHLMSESKLNYALAEVGEGNDELLLAVYDRMGGFIQTAGGKKVQTGCFWDLKNRKPKEKAEVELAPENESDEQEVVEVDVSNDLETPVVKKSRVRRAKASEPTEE